MPVFEKKIWSSPIIATMASPRLFPRRTVLLVVVVFALMGLLMLTGSNVSQICEDGQYCNIPAWREKLGSSPMTGNAESIDQTAAVKYGKLGQVGQKAQSSNHECATFANTSSVLTVMKTGASEAYSKIPTQLMTSLKCLPDFLIFSDMAQQIAGFTIHDSLDTVIDSVKQTNKDFELYHRQKQCPIDQESCNKNHDVVSQGWNLDKYKNIHMAEKTYKMRPNYDWYLFVDADSYVAYPTLVEWLKTLDPSKPHYIGSIAYLGTLPFGHGGSGYLLSKTTMHAMFDGKTEVANKYDEPVQHTCCGDAMLSKALKDETGIEPYNAWPTINGEKPHTLPYGEDEWCQPIVTMHHVAAEEISDLYSFELERNFSQPLRIKDLFHKFMAPYLTEARPDWDNLSKDVLYLDPAADHEESDVARAKTQGLTELETVAHRSFDDCKAACLSFNNCFQFLFQNGICGVAHKIKHGKPVKRGTDDSKRFMSGWNIGKIRSWIAEQGDCDHDVDWPHT